MGLFSKDKDTQDLKLTQEIKNVSNELPKSTNISNSTTPLESTSQPSSEKNDFYNPFSNNATNQNIQSEQQATQPIHPLPTQTPNPEQQATTTQQPLLNQNQFSQQQQKEEQKIQTNIPPIDELNSSLNQPITNPIEQKQPEPQNNSIFQTSEQKSTLPSDTKSQNPTPTQTQPLGTETQENFSKDRIQEIVDETVEQVIEERWKGIVQKIEKVAAWKEKQEAHINLVKEDIVTMKDAFEKLEKRIIDKVSSYDRNILDVNSEIKALEKVFQKITPTLVNNVNELSKIAKTFKEDSNTEKIE